MAGNREQGPRAAPRGGRGRALRARQRLGAALALALLAGAAGAECPKALGNGLILSTADGQMSMTYRPFLPGYLSEDRTDDRPGMPDTARRLTRIAAMGIIAVDSHSSTGWIRNDFSADPALLAQLPETGVWETGISARAGTNDRTSIFALTGRQVVRFAGHDTRSVGDCRYPVWVIEHERTIERPDRPPSVQLFRQWWAPALGVAIGVTDAAAEGYGPEIPFARIEALP